MKNEMTRKWGIADRGVLEVGKAADLVLLNLDQLHNHDQEYVDDMPGMYRLVHRDRTYTYTLRASTTDIH
jgi:imidazolonepropionase-like amidohydrolase